MNGSVEGFASAILKHVREERQRIVDKLAHHGISNFNEYEACMGQIQCCDALEARIRQLIDTHSGDPNDF